MLEIFRRARQVQVWCSPVVDTVIVGTIEYDPPSLRAGLNNIIGDREIVMGRSGTLRNFTVQHDAAQLVSPQVAAVYVNGIITAITITIAVAAPLGFVQDLTNTVNVVAGDLVTIGYDSPAGSTAARILSHCLEFHFGA